MTASILAGVVGGVAIAAIGGGISCSVKRRASATNLPVSLPGAGIAVRRGWHLDPLTRWFHSARSVGAAEYPGTELTRIVHSKDGTRIGGGRMDPLRDVVAVLRSARQRSKDQQPQGCPE
jgi:hypothetical protein